MGQLLPKWPWNTLHQLPQCVTVRDPHSPSTRNKTSSTSYTEASQLELQQSSPGIGLATTIVSSWEEPIQPQCQKILISSELFNPIPWQKSGAARKVCICLQLSDGKATFYWSNQHCQHCPCSIAMFRVHLKAKTQKAAESSRQEQVWEDKEGNRVQPRWTERRSFAWCWAASRTGRALPSSSKLSKQPLWPALSFLAVICGKEGRLRDRNVHSISWQNKRSRAGIAF